MKQCSKCRQVKPLTEFWRDANTKDGYRSQCITCRKRYRKDNQIHLAEYGREWRERNPSYGQDYSREWQVQHPEYRFTERYKESHRKANRRWYKNNKEQKDRQVKEWRRKHPNRVTQWDRDKRARKKRAKGNFTQEEFRNLCECFDNHCLHCGSTTKLEPDHIIPLSKNGPNNISNIQPLCRSCNASKGTKTADYR